MAILIRTSIINRLKISLSKNDVTNLNLTKNDQNLRIEVWLECFYKRFINCCQRNGFTFVYFKKTMMITVVVILH